MADKHPAKHRRVLLEEANDPSTDPERLRKLARNENKAVRRAVQRNPSLPEDVWRKVLLDGQPEAWANPMTPIYLLAWTPHKKDWNTLEDATRLAAEALWKRPDRCSVQGKTLLNAKIQAWWATSEDADDMMSLLAWWADAKGNGSQEHREAVRITIVCVRTIPDLTTKDRQAFDILQAWSEDGKDGRKKAKDLASSVAVRNTIYFAENTSYRPWHAIFALIDVLVSDKEGKEAERKHFRLLTNVIRQARPLPPVVE
jgi:hypothetical protein